MHKKDTKKKKKQQQPSKQPTNAHMHIYNLQERVQVFIGHADLVLSSIKNSHLCEGEVTLMGTN